MALGVGLDLMTRAVQQRPWTPRFLFGNGEQGAWYDPSDFSTLYQDSAGTTPVTQLGQPVGLMLDKSQGAVVSGPELVTNGTFDAGITGWSDASESGGSISWNPSGYLDLTTGATNANEGKASQAVTTVANTTYEMSFDVVSGGGIVIQVAGIATVPFGVGSHSLVFVAQATSTLVIIRNFANTNGTSSIDNVSVREIPGNHALQSTSTARPTVQARANLLERTEEFDQSPWIAGGVGVALAPVVTANDTVAPDGTTTADRVDYDLNGGTSVGDYSTLSQSFAAISGVAYTGSIWVKAATAGDVGKEIAIRVGGGASYLVIVLTDSWVRVTRTETSPVTGNRTFELVTRATITDDDQVSVYVWGAQLEVGSAATTYQRVTTATDYADVGAPRYLEFDGVDDALSTASVDFSASDEMTVCAGVEKLSDAAFAVVSELSADANTNNGTYYVGAPGSATVEFAVASRGTSFVVLQLNNSSYAAPFTAVQTLTAKISTPIATLRMNGAQVLESSITQGTGSYGNYPLYIGARGGSSAHFDGKIHQLIIRGATTSGALLDATERYVANRTGVTL